MKNIALLLLASLLAGGACATTTPKKTSTLADDDNLPTRRVTPPRAKVAVPPSALVVSLPGGHQAIRRSALLDLQRLGAQSFIQQVRVRPAFRHGRFHGWRVVAYRGPGTLLSGDVVTRINGRPIERPEQFMGVWEGLASSDKLVVELIRAGKSLVYRLPIVEAPGSAPIAHD